MYGDVHSGLPEVTEGAGRGDLPSWHVKRKLFVWERPLHKSDLKALGDAAPKGIVLGARVPDEGAKFALAESDPGIYFTTPHFNGYPAILITLDNIEVARARRTHRRGMAVPSTTEAGAGLHRRQRLIRGSVVSRSFG